jgi:hypothetical protein
MRWEKDNNTNIEPCPRHPVCGKLKPWQSQLFTFQSIRLITWPLMTRVSQSLRTTRYLGKVLGTRATPDAGIPRHVNREDIALLAKGRLLAGAIDS